MGFQKGDKFVFIGDQRVTLRLTLGALAEISERLSVIGPAALLTEMSVLDLPKARIILDCLIRPCLEEGVPLSDRDVANALPQICEVFEYAFG